VHPAAASFLANQSGVVSRRQLHAAGAKPHDLERMLRRRELARIHDGVYVAHTGTPTFVQRAWAGVLWAWPAAACGPTALRLTEGEASRRRGEPIHVVVQRPRRLDPPPGVVLQRSNPAYSCVVWTQQPPRVRYEDAAIQMAASASTELAAFAELAATLHTRRTTPQRLTAALARRPRLPRRRWLEAVLADLESGATSVLERGYVQRVERPHSLPRAERQVRERGPEGVVYRDALYRMPGGVLVVELDGRSYHDDPEQRERDLRRDLAVAATSRSTVRVGWSQVFGDTCHTASLLVRCLRGLGWAGSPSRCGVACTL
jgi:hypothetical protein